MRNEGATTDHVVIKIVVSYRLISFKKVAKTPSVIFSKNTIKSHKLLDRLERKEF